MPATDAVAVEAGSDPGACLFLCNIHGYEIASCYMLVVVSAAVAAETVATPAQALINRIIPGHAQEFVPKTTAGGILRMY